MKKHLYSLSETIALIDSGKTLVITADASLLRQLPAGKWIGGTIPYFMSESGGVLSKELLMIDDFSEVGIDFSVKTYSATTVHEICNHEFENAFTVFIAPLDSTALTEFSLKSLYYENIFKNPIVGYVSGFDMAQAAHEQALVFYGPTQTQLTQDAVALHVKLPHNKVARSEIINPNSIDDSSPSFVFPKDSFVQSECLINGKPANIAQYFTDINKTNNSLPLVADCGGALINRDVRSIDIEKGEVSFYSPVYAGDVYRMAKPITDYLKLFEETLHVDKKRVCYSCLCVSYYFLGQLEGKMINVDGAFTFGEIGYQLLNQTAVYLVIDSF